jgi:phenylpropionate dioxygenase-like ring-hydroxylating dioxygenase large terminal subunit
MPIINEDQVRAACAHNQQLNDAQFAGLKRTSSDVDAILAEIERIAQLPLNESVTMPREVYTSEAFHAWEIDHIFKPGWFSLAHVSQIPGNGDFINLELFGNPIIVVRGKAGEVRVLSRVCPHRGMDIMPPAFGHEGHGPADWTEGKPGCGHTRLFVCPYHSWTFELDGRLKACPEMQAAKDFRRDDWGLHEFRCEVWHGFVFVNLDGLATQTVAEQYAEIGEELVQWNPEGMKIVFERTWDVPCNWKILTENFMESYHHLGAHAHTLQPQMAARDSWNEKERPHSIRCHLPYRPALCAKIAEADAAGQQADTFPLITSLKEENRLEWGLMLGQPLFTLLTAPDQIVWYRMIPIGPDRLQLLTTVLVPESTCHHPEFAQMLARGGEDAIGFHLEDMEVVTAVQRSMYSEAYQRGRLSHLEMSVWLIQRYIAARASGTWPALDGNGAPSQRP